MMNRMSWDILISDLPKDAASIGDIPNDFHGGSIGQRSDLITAIREVEPEVDFTDPSWGVLETSDFVIEFNMGGEGSIRSFMLHVRGGGAATDFIGGLVHQLGLRAIDCSEGEFFDDSTAAASFARWQAFRDKAIRT